MNAWVLALAGLLAGGGGVSLLLWNRLRRAEHCAVAAQVEAEGLRCQLASSRDEVAQARQRLEGEQRARAAAEASLAAECKNVEQQQRLLGDAEIKLKESFKALAGDVLALQSQSFLRLASESFEKLRVQAGGDFSARQQAIEAIIEPLGESLKSYAELLRQLETARAEAYGRLGNQVANLAATSEALQQETRGLAAALKGGPQTRGRWGEMTLRRLLEMTNMAEHCDFSSQETLSGDGGRLRPDFIINLPGGRRIALDAKAPVSPFLDAIGATSESEKRQRLAHYAKLVRTHLNQLAAKAYWEQFQPSPEIVVLFLPGESFFGAALEQEPSLLEDGLQKRVMIATPTTLVALLHAVALGWKQETVEKNAREISDLGRQLYDRLRAFVVHFKEAGSGLRKAAESYNRASASLESRVLTAARKFKEMGAMTGEEIAELAGVEEVPRGLNIDEGELLPLRFAADSENGAANGAEKDR